MTASKSNTPLIGIDFGTNKTMLARYQRAKRNAKIEPLGRGTFEMPTTMYQTVICCLEMRQMTRVLVIQHQYLGEEAMSVITLSK